MRTFLKKWSVAGSVLTALVLTSFIYATVPPLTSARAQFTAQALFITNLALGTANAQTIVIPNVGSYSDIRGVPVTFIPRLGVNTGPTTLNVNGLGSYPVLRNTPGAPSELGGGELTSDAQVTVMFLGAKFIIVSVHDITPVGTTIEFRGSTAPTGYLIEDGSCVSQTNYPPLFATIGASYGSCSAGLFALPDSRGTVFAATDNQGVNGSAGRITNAGSGCTATSVPFSCGAQNKTVTTAFLPASGLSVPALSVPALSIPSLSVAGLSVPALSIPSLSVSTATSNVGNIPLSTGAVSSLQTQGNATTNITPANVSGTWSSTTSLAGSGSTGTGSTGTGTTGTGSTGTGSTGTGSTGIGTTGAMGSGTAMPVLNPILGGIRAIKF